MACSSVETTDIFRSAFFLCNGGDLCSIQVKPGERSRVAVFVIRGEGLEELDRMYRNGKALVNPVQFRESLTHLRDLLYDKLRNQNRGDRHNDRKRENRPYKTTY